MGQEHTKEWIEAAVRRTTILGIAFQTLRAIPTKIEARADDPKTFDVELSFELQTEPYKDDGRPRKLSPEAHFRQEVEAAVNAKHENHGYKIGILSHKGMHNA
ncbi:MAG: hypothetical protein AAF549_03415 [Pseudomonadota bacterium]